MRDEGGGQRSAIVPQYSSMVRRTQHLLPLQESELCLLMCRECSHRNRICLHGAALLRALSAPCPLCLHTSSFTACTLGISLLLCTMTRLSFGGIGRGCSTDVL